MLKDIMYAVGIISILITLAILAGKLSRASDKEDLNYPTPLVQLPK